VTRGDIGWNLLAYGIYQPLDEPVEFAMTGSLPGSNWYPCEEAASGGHRWTGPLTETTLELPLAPKLDFEISMHVLIAELSDLTVHVGDTQLPIRAGSSEGRMHRIVFWVPAHLVESNDLTTLRFQTREVFQPSATDIRLLSSNPPARGRLSLRWLAAANSGISPRPLRHLTSPVQTSLPKRPIMGRAEKAIAEEGP
jgi:hypothetical protein